MKMLLGLGGNSGVVLSGFRDALGSLKSNGSVNLLEVSSLYRTTALGKVQQDFLNAAVLLEISCSPRSFLGSCNEIEAGAGRRRRTEERWGPRPLDLDLLISPDVVCAGSDLMLPHPRLQERAFALVPAAELVGSWVHPFVGETLENLSRKAWVRKQGVEKIRGPDWVTLKDIRT